MENAFGGEHPEEYRKLLIIGKEIAETLRECSPLATKVVSGLLRDNLDGRYWCTVLKHCQQLVGPRSMVRPFILGCKLPPHHLQSCFAVFGIPSLEFHTGGFDRPVGAQWCDQRQGEENQHRECCSGLLYDLLKKAFIQASQGSGLYKVNDMLRDTALYIGPIRSNAFSKKEGCTRAGTKIIKLAGLYIMV